MEILHEYGITQEAMGVPVVAKNEVTRLGIQAYFDTLYLTRGGPDYSN